MAALAHGPPRTPSPKIKIHHSQSFDSPSSRITVTPIEESPYSKSASAILPRHNALKATERSITLRSVQLHTKLSDDSIMSDDYSSSEASSDEQVSPDEEDEEKEFGLFTAGSPDGASPISSARTSIAATRSHPYPYTFLHAAPPQILGSTLSIYQDVSSPVYDPWLVRVVLDLFDVRGFDWMVMAEMIGRVWGVRTSSAEVLGILSGNGRVERAWWD